MKKREALMREWVAGIMYRGFVMCVSVVVTGVVVSMCWNGLSADVWCSVLNLKLKSMCEWFW